MENNPSYFKGDNLPVENVSWEDVQQFIQKMNGRNDGYTYRLPTEAEWEYAARAGSNGKYSFGDDENRLSEYAWVFGNSGNTTHPAGQKKPNTWGLYDMHGNVWEWAQDWYEGNYDCDYSRDSPSTTDPRGLRSGLDRVIRGGGLSGTAANCRSAFRHYFSPGLRFNSIGFRLLRTAR